MSVRTLETIRISKETNRAIRSSEQLIRDSKVLIQQTRVACQHSTELLNLQDESMLGAEIRKAGVPLILHR